MKSGILDKILEEKKKKNRWKLRQSEQIIDAR